MREIVKKNQIVLFTIALMLIVAGYMHYTVNTDNILKTAAITDTEQYAEIGDARLVSSDAVISGNIEDIANTVDITERTEETAAKVEDNSESGNENSAEKAYFVQSRIDRDTMYSQMIESYEKILSNEIISETQRDIAENEIININNRKNSIMIAENLIKNKGIDDVIIFVNDKSINVIVRADELLQEQVAQIQNIIQREMNAETENIHISNK